MIGFMIVGGIVNSRLKNRIKKYSKIKLKSGLSGKEVAEKMLKENNIFDVKIISVTGKLTDHYNPLDKTINLSTDVYNGKHIASAAIAAHECGHALQHASGYQWLEFRSQMVPMVNYSNRMMSIIFLLGIFGVTFLKIFTFYQLIMLFIILQTIVTLFTVITLPVEYDASRRALAWLNNAKITNDVENRYAKDALKWAANTYIVAALAAVTYLLYYISMLKD